MYFLLNMGIVQPAMLVYWNLIFFAFWRDRKMDHQRLGSLPTLGSTFAPWWISTPRPSQLHCSETLSSLRFAARAKKIENMATWRHFCRTCCFLFWGWEFFHKFWVGGGFFCVVSFCFQNSFCVELGMWNPERFRKNGQLNKGNFQNLQLISPRMCHPVGW